MIQEIINSIVQAEDEAAKITLAAQKTAKDIKLKADNDYEKKVKENHAAVKEELKGITDKAQKDASAKASVIVKKGKEKSDKLMDKKSDNIKKASTEISRRILQKYGAC